MSEARPKRVRLDDLLVERGIATDRQAAQRLLMAGQVRVGVGDGARFDLKPGELVAAATIVADVVRRPFVSRGGGRGKGVGETFGIDVADRICLDVGASTGGFTDVLLRHGAARVYALDVGRGQLAEVLRRDARVVSMERTHAARLDPTSSDPVTLPDEISLAVIDVSFISLTRVLPGVVAALTSAGEIVALVKPQFEARAADAPHGVVREPAVQRAAIDKVAAFAATIGLAVQGELESPLVGPKGNHEFLLHLARV